MSLTTSSIILPAPPQIPSTQGLTTKVIKGSFWSLSGQVLPILVSLFATPFIIRLLGSETYGVYILILLIPSYFSFADFGMSIASTKFGSEAYANGSKEDEGKVVRTAAVIASLASLPVASAIFAFSYYIISWLKVPEQFHYEASIALKIASITFVLNILSSIFNTPQLSRLRMDLNTFVNVGFRLLGTIVIPIVLALGGGIISAVLVLLISSLLTLFGHFLVSGKLLSELYQLSINRSIIRPLTKFGGALVISGIAAILLVNLEKIVLVRVASVEALAYYSIAYTLANMATTFSGSMVQSLLPAFSQLMSPEKKEELNRLFSRSIRINVIGLFPIVMVLFVVAKPFFTIWAGENFGRESSVPFYVLLLGLFFNVITYIPHSTLMASGRSDILAKVYWVEIFPYIIATAILTTAFGSVGAAMAWSLRVFADALILLWLSKKIVGVSFNILRGKGYVFILVFIILLPPILAAVFINNYSFAMIILVPICLGAYSVLVWKKFLETEERIWITSKIYGFVNR